MDNSLITTYILITEKLNSNKFTGHKIKLKSSILCRQEDVDYDVIENFCNVLKKNTSFSGYLDISYNNLNEINLFHVICSVYENKNIRGLNIKGNKITNMIFQKILLNLEHNNFEYLNIQSTQLNDQQIKNIIFSTLNKKVQSLKLPFLNINTFQYLIKYLIYNDSIKKLHFFITYHNETISKHTQNNENVIGNYQNYVHSLRNLFKQFIQVVEDKANIKNVKCKMNFHDDEIEEMISFINSVCEKHKRNSEKDQKMNEHIMRVTPLEKIQLLISDINGTTKHIEKFEKEVQMTFDKDVITFLQKILP
ncbi:conserved Plasmodium protein, unknown function [Plasmodium malariae]|uniref:Leucine-rich repeat protein n=1 Tax=Plasmodium malariae TaxID=5858 RepID=A0A1C3L3A4_PLAMA|nr:conserved Plasmodium protein, unknown function [Plasmodium malariae]